MKMGHKDCKHQSMLGLSLSYPRKKALEVMVELPKINLLGFNEVIVPKNEKDSYGSKGYLCSLELSTAPLEPKFGVASHFMSSHNDDTDSRNQIKHQYIQEALLAILQNRRGQNQMYSI